MPYIEVEDIINLSKENQIIKLMSEIKCTLAPSKVHGIGVFALMDIKKGQKCYCLPNEQVKWYSLTYTQLKKLWPEQRDLILQRWASVINGSLFTSPNDDVSLILFMNHSSDVAKVNYDIKTDCALMDIPKGEELLEDYRIMDNWQVIYPWIDKKND